MNGPVDVLEVMDRLADLARHRLTMKRRDFDRKVAAGKKPHYDVEIKADRAEYIFQQGREARAAVSELIEKASTLEAVVSAMSPPSATADIPEVVAALRAIRAALARVQGGAA